MKVYNNICYADEGKHFVIARKVDRSEHATLASYEVGEDFVLLKYIENGMIKEDDIPGFEFGLPGFKVGYYHNGYFLHCGNPQVFPTRKAAESYANHYKKYPWFTEEIVIEEATWNGVPLSEPKTYNEKPIVDNEHYFGLDAHEIGELFHFEVVEWFRDCVPPAWCSDSLIQCGEPASHIDGKATHATFKRIEGDVWEYCGECFSGETNAN